MTDETKPPRDLSPQSRRCWLDLHGPGSSFTPSEEIACTRWLSFEDRAEALWNQGKVTEASKIRVLASRWHRGPDGNWSPMRKLGRRAS